MVIIYQSIGAGKSLAKFWLLVVMVGFIFVLFVLYAAGYIYWSSCDYAQTDAVGAQISEGLCSNVSKLPTYLLNTAYLCFICVK